MFFIKVFMVGLLASCVWAGAAIDFPTQDPAWNYQSIKPPVFENDRSQFRGYDEKRGVPEGLNTPQTVDKSTPLYHIHVTLEGTYKDGSGRSYPLSPVMFQATLGESQSVLLKTSCRGGATNKSQTITYDYRLERGTPTLYLDTKARGVIVLPVLLVGGQTVQKEVQGDKYGTLQDVKVTLFAPLR